MKWKKWWIGGWNLENDMKIFTPTNSIFQFRISENSIYTYLLYG